MLKPLLAVGLVALTLGQANAAVYANRSTFEGAITGGYTETFESLTPGTYTITGPLTLSSGLVVSSPTNDLFAAGSTQSSNATEAIGSNYPSSDSLNFALGGTYFAFGADFFQNFGGGSQSNNPIDFALSFFDNGTLVDTITAQVASGGGSFIGYIGSAGFDSVKVLASPDSFEVADNVTVGNPGKQIPEPTSLALAGLGIAALAARRTTKSA